MSPINGVGGNLPIQRPSAPAATNSAAPATTSSPKRAADKLDLSGASLLQSLKTNNIRADKVASVKAQIEKGTYEDDHKLNVAVDGLLDDLQK